MIKTKKISEKFNGIPMIISFSLYLYIYISIQIFNTN